MGTFSGVEVVRAENELRREKERGELPSSPPPMCCIRQSIWEEKSNLRTERRGEGSGGRKDSFALRH